MAVEHIAMALSAAAHAMSALKLVAEKLRASGKSELMQDFIGLQTAMSELLLRQQELIEDLRQVREEKRRLEDELTKKKQIELHHKVYWLRTEDGSLEGPFSRRSWDNENKLVRLVHTSDERSAEGLQRFTIGGRDRINSEGAAVPYDFLVESRWPQLSEMRWHKQGRPHDEAAG